MFVRTKKQNKNNQNIGSECTQRIRASDGGGYFGGAGANAKGEIGDDHVDERRTDRQSPHVPLHNVDPGTPRGDSLLSHVRKRGKY